MLTVATFLPALRECFKTAGCIPKCTEQVQCVYDTSPLLPFLDNYLARVALPEKSGDNVHHMTFRHDENGKAVMRYKLLRASVAA